MDTLDSRRLGLGLLLAATETEAEDPQNGRGGFEYDCSSGGVVRSPLRCPEGRVCTAIRHRKEPLAAQGRWQMRESVGASKSCERYRQFRRLLLPLGLEPLEWPAWCWPLFARKEPVGARGCS